MADVLPDERSVGPNTHREWLDGHLDAWVEVGIIDSAQRDAIAVFEQTHPVEPSPPPRRLGIGAEVAAYLGSVLALTGGAAAIGDSWNGLPFATRVGLGLVIALVGLGVGGWLFRIGEAGTDRLGGFVTSLGVGGVALATGVTVDRVDPRDDAWIAVVVGLVVVAVSVALWRNRDRPLQLATALVGFGVAAGGTASLADDRFFACGLVLIGAGALVAVFGHLGRVVPELIALGGGGTLAFVGAFMLGDLNRHLGPATALAVALVFVVYAVRTGGTPLLVGAIFGATIASTDLLSTTFASAVSAMVIALIGLVLVGVVISRSTRRAPG